MQRGQRDVQAVQVGDQRLQPAVALDLSVRAAVGRLLLAPALIAFFWPFAR